LTEEERESVLHQLDQLQRFMRIVGRMNGLMMFGVFAGGMAVGGVLTRIWG
jgi:hypothetical protein